MDRVNLKLVYRDIQLGHFTNFKVLMFKFYNDQMTPIHQVTVIGYISIIDG